MTTRIAITHRIDRSFSRTIRLGTHWLRLRPAPETHARITAYSLKLDPQPHFVNWLRDPFENPIARVDLPEPLPHLNLAVEILAELEPKNPFDFLIEPYAAKHPFEYTAQQRKELAPYLALGGPSARVRAFFATLEQKSVATVQRLTDTCQQLLAAFPEFAPAAISSRQDLPDLETLLAEGTGSAWDLAWLFTLSLRQHGLAARFTCGYKLLLADVPDQLDSVSLHAWTETFVPGAGWLGLDPCSGLFTDETFVPLSSGPEPARVRPLVGTREPCEETRVESLRVRRLTPDEPRWPYTETQWHDICALGAHVQHDLEEQRVFLSTRMSLAFVAPDSSAPEWHTHALGPDKLRVGQQLLDRLVSRTAAGAVQHVAQGEWFGGEGLPRWRLIGLARSDGQPVWRAQDVPPPTAANELSAYELANALARALGVAPAYISAAHEDPLHNVWRGQHVTERVPSPSELDDPERRRALAEQFSQMSGNPVGYVLPLAWDHSAARFRSAAWRFRRPGLHLVPGASPIGYRLPLDSLLEDKQALFEAQLERSPFEERAQLPDYHGTVRARLDGPIAQPVRDTVPPRTAVCVQARGGQLFVFLPPLSHAEHYLEIVAAVQAAAEATEQQPILEGYEPPEDFRLRRFVIEPDPGVLRVELPDSFTFQVQLDLLQTTFEEARALGLGMQRTTPEGTSVASGAGGRLCLGGLRPEFSPFLRRPELLGGLIAYFQRHPSLSYLFAGRMIGPSGPAPRPDEGRDAALYELSIALSQLPKGEVTALWQGDRMLRHLLSDPAGQIKHAEIRMDHLYAPERDSKRQGRVYIHAFELAPHPQIAALHALLVHGLIGKLAHAADSCELTRWGSALHDRFMLPHVLRADLQSVIEELQAAGYPFQVEWFEPLIALRFPEHGQVSIGSITLSLQTALEPWPLLAEEVTAGGVTRFIDAANERLQVKLSGLTPGRYVLACNGQGVPLQATGTHGEFVAGVRYKIANPPSTLHPTIAPAGPLVFDLIDTWTGRAIGGCSYLPPQPQLWGALGVPLGDGHWPTVGDESAPQRAEPTPQTSLAPLSRAGRFLPQGSGLGPMATPHRVDDPYCPFLLDLAHR
ncbi:MAG TPA: transglutaminase family protein [Polyangiales bacterium]|nr:transglutaminase family protein [Polyangiales bacterium]